MTTLPEYATGWTFPEVGLDGADLSVVRCPATCGIVYTAGTMGEDRMDPELANMWIEGAEVGSGVCVLQYKTPEIGRDYASVSRLHRPVEHAAAAAMHCCITGEELGEGDRIEVPQLSLRGAERYFGVILDHFGVRSTSIYHEADRLGGADDVRARLERRYPWLQTAVRIPNNPASA